MSYLRTPEHCLQQAKRIRSWEPWKRSTGPSTVGGKAKAARNAWKGGERALLRELVRQMREQRQA